MVMVSLSPNFLSLVHEMMPPIFSVGLPISVNPIKKLPVGISTDQPNIDNSSLKLPSQVILDMSS